MAERTCSVDGCDRETVARGWCETHYRRWYSYGDALAPRRRGLTTEERFSRKWEQNAAGCWVWTSTTNRDGYGSFWNGERRPRAPGRPTPIMVLAHRWSYAHHVAPIPERLNVLHRCDNPPCINPGHLFLGTQAENVQDCADKGRRNQTRYRKLSPEAHAEIRERYGSVGSSRGPKPRGANGVSQTQLADEYGVSQRAISHIVRSA